MVMTRCDYCNKPINVKPKRLEKYKHNFCNRDHYFKWRKQHPVKPKQKPDLSMQEKLNAFAKKREELNEKRR